MKVDMRVWMKYRREASAISQKIMSYKDANGVVQLGKEPLENLLKKITAILKESLNYLTRCGLTMRKPLWDYKIGNYSTRASNVAFLYKDRMSEQCIYKYGKSFMRSKVTAKS